jgi:DNA-binding GntR family transcriptional regulator
VEALVLRQSIAKGGAEHTAIFDAALARNTDRAVDLLTRHLETTARHLEAIAPDVDAEPSAANAAAD